GIWCIVSNPKVLCYLFKFLHDREDKQGGQQTAYDKHTPYHPQLHASPQITDDGNQIVTNGSCSKPTTHHHTFVLGRSYFRNERDTHRRQEKLGKSKNQISGDQPVRRNQRILLNATGSQSVRSRQTDRADSHDQETTYGNHHTDTDFTRCRRFFSFSGQIAEHCQRNRSQSDHEERIKLLEDLWQDVDCRIHRSITPSQAEECHHNYYTGNRFRLSGFTLKQ